MKVRIPTPLRSYTGNQPEVDVAVDMETATVDQVLFALDRQFPGIRFRIVDEQGRLRQHVNVFVAGERCRDLDRSVAGLQEVVIMQALSGG